MTTPFLPAVVAAVRSGAFWPQVRADDPLSLAGATIYVPGRRAARMLARAFLEAADDAGGAAILPRIVATADVSEDDALAFDASASADPPVRELGASPDGSRDVVLDDLARRLAMIKLIETWPGPDTPARHDAAPVLLPCSPADAAVLAADLIRLMDEVGRERADWARLKTVVAEALSGYWGVALDFLDLASKAWPETLRRMGALDAAHEHDRIVLAEAARIRDRADEAARLIIGSAAFTPAIADLTAAVLEGEGGVAVLPGLDLGCDEADWALIRGDEGAPDFGHAQSGLCRLIEHVRVPRADVEEIAGDAVSAARAHLLSRTLRPAETTDRWADAAERLDRDAVEAALEDVVLMEARDEHEQALGVAVALREALERGERDVALVTPDRTLARRVETELRRWGLEVDDSGGRPLGTTPPAVFMRLLIEAAQTDCAPVPLLALLKSPLAAPPDHGSDVYRGDVRALERAALRGLAPPPGLEGLETALDARSRRRAARAAERNEPIADDATDAAARRTLATLRTALADLAALFAAAAPVPLHEIARLHRAAALVLAGERLWAEEDGEALRAFFDGLERDAPGGDPVRLHPREYAAFLVALMQGRAVRRRRPAHPRISILGLLEARQLAFETIVLAGLNEGVWPARRRNDAWLSRPMRAALGLPPPERRVGEAAHDFAQGFASRRVVLARPLRSGGAPTIAARWLQRLDAVAGDATKACRARGRVLLDCARTLDAAGTARLVMRPAPRPPVALRPRRLSISDVETWIRAPYSLYAKHVLRLRPLDPPGETPGARERGNAVHQALEAWSAHDPHAPDAHETLRRLFDDALADHLAHAEAASVWRRQLHAAADALVERERARRRPGVEIAAEIAGEWAVPGTGAHAGPAERAAPFVLTGRADRIEIDESGGLHVIDYKTGAAPTAPQMASGLSPQLALNAAMAAGGGFEAGLPEGVSPLHGRVVSGLSYVLVKGVRGKDAEAAYTPGKDRPNPADLVARTVEGLQRLVTAYEDEAQAYPSMPRAQWRLRYGAYDHLARVREWGLADDGDAGEAT